MELELPGRLMGENVSFARARFDRGLTGTEFNILCRSAGAPADATLTSGIDMGTLDEGGSLLESLADDTVAFITGLLTLESFSLAAALRDLERRARLTGGSFLGVTSLDGAMFGSGGAEDGGPSINADVIISLMRSSSVS